MDSISYRKRDFSLFLLLTALSIAVLGYQLFFYYFPVWEEKVPTHWSNKPMADDWMAASDWYFFIIVFYAAISGGILAIGYVLSKFFIMGTEKFRYTPFTMSLSIAFALFFFAAGINESVYASYLKNGIISNTSIGTIYFAISGIGFIAVLLLALLANIGLQKKAK